MERFELNSLKVDELRKMAKEKGLRGTDRYKLSKAELINYVLGEPAYPNEPSVYDDMKTHSQPIQPDTETGEHDLIAALSGALKGKIAAGVDRDEVIGIVKDTMKEDVNRLEKGLDAAITEIVKDVEKHKTPKAVTVTVKTWDDETPKDMGLQHYLFPKVLAIVARRRNLMLVGPAGSGKTYLAGSVADALKLTYAAISVGAQTTKTDLLGYMDATGNYVSSLLRKQYENGGIFLIDEIDAGNPNVITTLNAMTSNGVASFPDSMVTRHKDFVCIAAANTYGKGNDRQYVGRNALDAATLNRFVFLTMDYDEGLENSFTDNEVWKSTIRQLRKSAAELKERVIVSPRATLHGAELLEDGFTTDEALDMTVFQGVAEDVKSKIKNHAGV